MLRASLLSLLSLGRGAAAQMWMLKGNELFGGLSPLQLIKAGRGDEARDAAEKISNTERKENSNDRDAG